MPRQDGPEILDVEFPFEAGKKKITRIAQHKKYREKREVSREIPRRQNGDIGV
jgi:hypothetical protein